MLLCYISNKVKERCVYDQIADILIRSWGGEAGPYNAYAWVDHVELVQHCIALYEGIRHAL